MTPPIAEFDAVAEDYLATHAVNLRISGEQPEFFARQKAQEVRRRWFATRAADPQAILDFGAGIGNAWPHLREAFPGARLTGLDVSVRSLEVAERRFPGLAEPLRYDGASIPLPPGRFDLVFSACVFHHIDAGRHVDLLVQLRRLLKPGGMLAIFEHNPLNPLTRHIVATCPFDENAVLIRAPVLRRRQLDAGFGRVEIAYTGFFPAALSGLRPLERHMTGLPLGAQFYTLATE